MSSIRSPATARNGMHLEDLVASQGLGDHVQFLGEVRG